MKKLCVLDSVVESSAKARHENVKVGFESSQMIESVVVDLLHDVLVEASRVHVLWANRQNSVGEGNVHVGRLFRDAVGKHKRSLRL